jgi:hypothetical protein
MDCNLARRLLPYSHPGDLDAPDRAALAHHLDACPACAAAGAADRAFDASLARAMRTVPIPDGLPVRLHGRLLAARMAFYRLVAVLGLLVAGVAFAAWFGWSAWRRPAFDPWSLARQTYEMGGQSRSNDEARDLATAWLRQFDDRLQAPDDFNYKLLAFAERTDFQGLSGVPTLVFSRNDATMRLYVVREHAFKNLGDVREPAEDGGCTVECRRYDAQPGWVFILVTAGAAPDAFRPPQPVLAPA